MKLCPLLRSPIALRKFHQFVPFPTATAKMTSIADKLPKFVSAMQRIYSIPTSPSETAWTPPPASSGHKGRYLWTDAFGVLNLLTLAHYAESPHYLTLAQKLVATVHDILGRTRDLQSRLPRATDAHPLSGGLRIGKDDETGPDGDGQYHHYLTLWMFALNRLSIATRERKYNDQAIELAKAIHPHFVYARGSARPRMYWKMSMELDRPLVRSEGNLDPVDGLVVFKLLQDTDTVHSDGNPSSVLTEEIGDYEKIVRTKWRNYRSDDPLDLGMTLWTAHFFAEGNEWSEGLLQRAKDDLSALFDGKYFNSSTKRRLAFREFGTCLGIRCGAALEAAEKELWEQRADSIVSAWEKTGAVPVPEEKTRPSDHNSDDHLMPITLVMYAAALIPGAFHKEFFNTPLA